MLVIGSPGDEITIELYCVDVRHLFILCEMRARESLQRCTEDSRQAKYIVSLALLSLLIAHARVDQKQFSLRPAYATTFNGCQGLTFP